MDDGVLAQVREEKTKVTCLQHPTKYSNSGTSLSFLCRLFVCLCHADSTPEHTHKRELRELARAMSTTALAVPQWLKEQGTLRHVPIEIESARSSVEPKYQFRLEKETVSEEESFQEDESSGEPISPRDTSSSEDSSSESENPQETAAQLPTSANQTVQSALVYLDFEAIAAATDRRKE